MSKIFRVHEDWWIPKKFISGRKSNLDLFSAIYEKNTGSLDQILDQNSILENEST